MTATTEQQEEVPENPLQHAVQTEDVDILCKALFDIELYPTQVEIVQDIAYQKEKNIVINAYTRYGKTFAVGIGIALYLVLNNNSLDDYRIGIVAPTDGDAQNLRKEMLKAGANSELFQSMVDMGRSNDYEDMLKSRNKDTLTFNDGAIELHNVSASSGKSGDGSGAMGEGFDLVVMDESNRISHRFWKESGDRLREHEDSVLIEMGNPFHKDNQFYSHWTRNDFKKFHVDEEKGIEEGRHSKEWFDNRSKEVGGRQSLEYQVLYKSEFPDQIDGGLVKHSWLDNRNSDNKGAKQKYFQFEEYDVVYGFDVAGSGKDKAVLMKYLEEKNSDRRKLVDVWSRKHVQDTMKLTGWALNKVEEKQDATIKVDGIGIGEGVADRMKERGYNVVKVKVGESPESEADRFVNKKARYYWRLRNILEAGDLDIPEDVPGDLIHQLTHIEYDFNSREKIRIVDPESGSPDYGDSLMLCMATGSRMWIL